MYQSSLHNFRPVSQHPKFKRLNLLLKFNCKAPYIVQAQVVYYYLVIWRYFFGKSLSALYHLGPIKGLLVG